MIRPQSQSAQPREWQQPAPPPTEDDVRKWPGAICTACKRVFARDAPFKTMFIPCFKAGRGSPRASMDDAHLWLQLSIHTLLADLHKLQAKVDDLTADLEEVEPPMPDDLLKDLIFFAHPDRNGGSERATKVTRVLNAIRDARAG